jgi:hypothetical protein
MAGGTEPNYVLVVLGHEAWTITENLILGKNPEVEFININLWISRDLFQTLFINMSSVPCYRFFKSRVYILQDFFHSTVEST